VELPYAEEPQRRRRLEPPDDQPRAVALENDAGGRSRDEPERPRDTGRGGRDLRQDVRRLGCGLTRRHGERVAVARLDAGEGEQVGTTKLPRDRARVMAAEAPASAAPARAPARAEPRAQLARRRVRTKRRCEQRAGERDLVPAAGARRIERPEDVRERDPHDARWTAGRQRWHARLRRGAAGRRENRQGGEGRGAAPGHPAT